MLIDLLSYQKRVWKIHYEYSRDTHVHTRVFTKASSRFTPEHTHKYLPDVKFTAMKVLHIRPGDSSK